MPRPRQTRKIASCRTRLREAARRGEDRVDQDRAHQRALASEAIGDDAEDDAAGGGGELA